MEDEKNLELIDRELKRLAEEQENKSVNSRRSKTSRVLGLIILLGMLFALLLPTSGQHKAEGIIGEVGSDYVVISGTAGTDKIFLRNDSSGHTMVQLSNGVKFDTTTVGYAELIAHYRGIDATVDFKQTSFMFFPLRRVADSIAISSY